MIIKIKVSFPYQEPKETEITVNMPEEVFKYYDIENVSNLVDFLHDEMTIDYDFEDVPDFLKDR